MQWIESVISHMPSWAELGSAMPVILSLILIEGLLSVDNAMAIAAMASKLPKHQQKLALRLGIIGAYGFRGLCLFFVAWIASNPWIKIFGSIYLIYLMCSHLTHDEDDANKDGIADVKQKGLLATIIQIEIMDLSLSVDNVVAAVALDKRLWVICLGVFIGILALRFVAGYCIRLIEKFPILSKTAFLLVGFVGVILLTELFLEYRGIHFHITSFQKFIGILAITALSLWYGQSPTGKRVVGPLVAIGYPIIKLVDRILGIVMWPLHFVSGLIKKMVVAAWNSLRGNKASVQTP